MSDIDDPFAFQPEVTVIRPRPGGVRRPLSEKPGALPLSESTAQLAFQSSRAVPSLVGLNPLVRSASPLLLLVTRLRDSLSGPDIAALRRHVLDEIRRFEEQARAAGVQENALTAARYALCASVDEAVLATPWGSQGEWAQPSLLVHFYRETWGGEKFFDMLDRLLVDPDRHADLIELLYLCLAFGFTGKYRVRPRGHEELMDVRQKLYGTIRGHRGVPPSELSLQWRGREDRRHRLVRYVPWWVVGAGALALLAIVFIVYYARLGSAASPIEEALSTVGRDNVAATPPPAGAPSLPELLRAIPQRAVFEVVPQGNRTRVILAAGDLFPSGSATPNPEYAATLARIGAALNRVPGRVLVEGHTDDQMLRSLRFRNNFELSRERAANVGRLLQRTLDSPARLEWAGLGSSSPRYQPESTAENRARNRRVEIIHIPGV